MTKKTKLYKDLKNNINTFFQNFKNSKLTPKGQKRCLFKKLNYLLKSNGQENKTLQAAQK